jgi:hypothetical protein
MLGKALTLASAGNAAPAGYQISRSLRFNSADSAYLNRTNGTSTDQKKFTLSFWMKRSTISTATGQWFFSAGSSYGTDSLLGFNASSDALQLSNSSVSGDGQTTTMLFRDTSAWYHVVVVGDSTQATNADRIKFYVNGVQQATSTIGTITLNSNFRWNTNSLPVNIGRWTVSGGNYANLYLAEIHNIDGQALPPSDFGETDATTGVWIPKEYTGTYGTNGFYLNFSDNSGVTSTTLGKDQAGSNNWTPNNFSVTAGAGNDSLVDTPTPYGDDTGAGGEVRGNYATLNAVAAAGGPLANGNLDIASSGYAGLSSIYGTIGVSSGKWYWEVTAQNSLIVGIGSAALTGTYPGQSGISTGWNVFFDITSAFYVSGGITNNASSGSGSAASAGDVIGVALDMDAGNLYLYKNGTVLNAGNPVATTIPAINMMPAFRGPDTNTSICNFGQRPFAYTAPSGFKALVTTNLPEPTVVQGDDYFNTVLYTGTGASQSITGVGFQPDFVWVKNRGAAYVHVLFDVVRGSSGGYFNKLVTSTTAGESLYAQGAFGAVTALNSDGFTVDSSNSDWNQTNASGTTYVAWNWKADGAGVSNTDGSITSTVSANTTAGISIVTYTGNGSAGATVGHGLGVAPRMIIAKSRSVAQNWAVYHGSLGNTKWLQLNSTVAQITEAIWNNTSPTSTVFSMNGNGVINDSGSTNVAYCFADVEGFSKFGSYTGNGSTDGPFVYTNFRPAFVLFKLYDQAGGNWYLFDSVRSTYNIVTNLLQPNLSSAEVDFASGFVDFTSNGFKIRTGSGDMNTNLYNYIYMAFAENPFKNSLAR